MLRVVQHFQQRVPASIERGQLAPVPHARGRARAQWRIALAVQQFGQRRARLRPVGPALARRWWLASSSASSPRAAAPIVPVRHSSWRSSSMRASRSSPPLTARVCARRVRAIAARQSRTRCQRPRGRPIGIQQGQLLRAISSAWCSCWPWISTSIVASSPSWPRLAGRPLIHAREPPSARITRRSWQPPSSSSSASFGQPGARGGQRGQIEFRRQFGAIAAGAHHAAVGAGARQQQQRIDQQRLAGAGFTA